MEENERTRYIINSYEKKRGDVNRYKSNHIFREIGNNGDDSLLYKVKNWFNRLNIEERKIILTVEDKELSDLIFSMYYKLKEYGQCIFYDVEIPNHNDMILLNNNDDNSQNKGRRRNRSKSLHDISHIHIKNQKKKGGSSKGESSSNNNDDIQSLMDIYINNKDRNEKDDPFIINDDNYYYYKIPIRFMDSNYCFRRINNMKYKMDFILNDNDNDLLLKSLLFFKTNEYYDTFTLSNELLGDVNLLFNIMYKLSKGNFLNNEKDLKLNRKISSWIDNMSFYSLSSFIVSIFEVILYKRFIIKSSNNNNNDSTPFTTIPLKKNVIKNYLIDYWNRLDTVKKKNIIISSYRSMIHSLKLSSKSNNNVGLSRNNKTYHHHHSSINQHQYYKAIFFMVDSFRIIRHLYGIINSPFFIHYIFHLPIHWIGTIIDIVLKRLCLSIENEYINDLCNELLMDEKKDKRNNNNKPIRKKSSSSKLKKKSNNTKSKKKKNQSNNINNDKSIKNMNDDDHNNNIIIKSSSSTIESIIIDSSLNFHDDMNDDSNSILSVDDYSSNYSNDDSLSIHSNDTSSSLVSFDDFIVVQSRYKGLNKKRQSKDDNLAILPLKPLTRVPPSHVKDDSTLITNINSSKLRNYHHQFFNRNRNKQSQQQSHHYSRKSQRNDESNKKNIKNIKKHSHSNTHLSNNNNNNNNNNSRTSSTFHKSSINYDIPSKQSDSSNSPSSNMYHKSSSYHNITNSLHYNHPKKPHYNTSSPLTIPQSSYYHDLSNNEYHPPSSTLSPPRSLLHSYYYERKTLSPPPRLQFIDHYSLSYYNEDSRTNISNDYSNTTSNSSLSSSPTSLFNDDINYYSPNSIHHEGFDDCYDPFPPIIEQNHLYRLKNRDESKCIALHHSIMNFVDDIDRIMNERKPFFNETIEHIKNIASSLWSGSFIEVYGSYSTNLSIPSSDIDIVIKNIGRHSNLSNELHKLESRLQRQDWVKKESIQCIDSASVPVVKFMTHRDIYVDITFDHLDQQQLHSGTSSRDLINHYLSIYPNLRPIILILKQMLHDNQLNNSYRGGLSSYYLILMSISFFQLYFPRSIYGSASHKSKQSNIGAILLDFLELYGIKFDFKNIKISILNGGSHTLLPVDDDNQSFFPYQPPQLVIVDPLNPSRTIGHQSTSMWQVKYAMERAYHILEEKFYHNDRQKIKSDLNIVNILKNVLSIGHSNQM